MKNTALTMAIFFALFSPAFILALDRAVIPEDSEIAPNEIRVYLQVNFQGPFLSYKIEPGMRQRLVSSISEAWEGRIKSVQIGPEAAVTLFQKKYFRFSGSGYVSFTSSVADISKSVPGAANKYMSLIVYPVKVGNPLGILAGSSASNDFRFFPLPEKRDETTYSYADIRHLVSPIDFVLLFFGKTPNSRVAATFFSKISWSGQSIRLPTQGGKERYNLADFNFAGRAQSLRIEQTVISVQMKETPQDMSQKPARKDIPLQAVQTAKGSCSISGIAKGPNAERAVLFSVTLYGPDDLKKRREVKKFSQQGRFTFSGLPEGRYRIIISPDPGKADIGYELKPPKPAEITIVCQKGKEKNIEFSFD
ncbi:hypothetical protein ACFLT2_08660 [Acidobacteriota bacterium]